MVGLVVSLNPSSRMARNPSSRMARNPSSRMARTIPVDVRGTLYSEEENKRV
jgi:hypothetical protein